MHRLSPYLIPLHLPEGVKREALDFARVSEIFQEFMAGVPFTEYDVMLECKGKELALLKLRQELHDVHVL